MRNGALLLALGCAACPPPPDPTPTARVRLEDGAPTAANDPPPALAPPLLPQGVEVFDLGLVAIAEGASPMVLIDVDDRVRSFTLLVSAQPEAHVIADLVVSPDGARVVDPDTPSDASRQARLMSRGFVGPLLSTNRMVPKRGGGAFVVPNTPDVALAPGTWRARLQQGVVAVAADGTVATTPLNRPVQLTVLVDTRATPERARLAVALHFTGANGITAVGGATDPLVQRVTSTLSDTFGAVGVDTEVAGMLDVDGGAALQTLVLEPDLCEDGDLARLLRALDPTPNAVDVVFVDRLQCLLRGITTADGFAGMSAAIPGDVLQDGGAHGGVAVALGVVGDDAAAAAHTVAHELGHLLGLFHTMELVSGIDPPIYDVISDTPDDPAFTANLMSVSPQGSAALSDGQAFVLAINPWLAASAE